MGFMDDVKTITDLLAQLNKKEDNVEIKKIALALGRLQKQMERHRDKARRDLIMASILSALGAFGITYFLKHYW